MDGLSQSPQVLYHITEENGLSDNHVRCILKDHNGFVWIGTADGLNVMDGSQVRVYKHREDDPQSPSGNEIDCLAQDTAGNIWAGTVNGLNCYNPITKRFTAFHCPVSPYGNTETIKSIVVDRQQNIWCATHGGLFLFNPSQKKFNAFYNPSSKGPGSGNRINYLAAGKDGTIWICTFEGLWSFDPKQHSFKKEIYADNDPFYDGLFTSVTEDHRGKIWAGCWSKGLKELDRLTGRVITHVLPAGMPDITCIAEVQQPPGNYTLWLSGPLYAYDPASGKFFGYTGSLHPPGYPYVSPCYQSADHRVWMASDHGVFIYNPHQASFQHFLVNDLTTSQNISFTEWKGLLMVAAQGKDFCRLYDERYHLIKDYGYLLHSFPLKEQRKHLSALSLLQPDSPHCWISTDNGIACLNTVTGENKWMLQQPPDSNRLHKNFITCMLLDAEKKCWLFPWRGGIWQLDKTGRTMQKVWDGFITEAGIKKKLVIADAAEDSFGNIWMADLDEGIILYEKKTGVFSKPLQEKTGERCHSNRIYCRNGYCYSVINNILMKWSSDLHFFKTYPLPFQMDKEIIDFVPDNNGLWWLATRNGLMVFNETQHTFQRFTEADGLRSNDMDGTLFCRKNGNIIFATQGYLTTFKPAGLLSSDSLLPVTLLTGIEENGKAVMARNTRPWQFNYNSNNLSFQWTIADFSDPFHNQFYCKLNGIDAGWRYAGNKGEIQYASLSPGKYELLLRGVTANGIMSKNIVRVPFIIQAPFWKTGWFIGACMLFTALLVYSWYRYRLRQALQLERLRSKISTDLHDDIGSTLSSISILSDMALKEKNNCINAGMMEEIKENAVLLMEKMDDIVWSINPKNDSLENLLLRIRKSATRLFEARNMDYRIEIQDNIKTIRLPMDYRQHVYLVMKEASNNLVKYAEATEAIIRVSYRNNILEVTIEDNGKGFNSSLPCTGNGILNMQQRAGLMNAGLLIDSTPGRGTIISLRIKIK
ncbi:MAG: hypothetical protein NVSMB7_05960 [Chitinophagaceae bacterium]